MSRKQIWGWRLELEIPFFRGGGMRAFWCEVLRCSKRGY